MKKEISLLLLVLIVISIFAGLNIDVDAEETTTQETTFPYSNASTYVADSIIKGVIDREGVAHGSSEISLALQHKYTYQNITEKLIDDNVLAFNSLFWQNLKSTLNGDFLNITNWQEEMYILLIIDYLNYYSVSDEFKNNYAKNTIKFTENIYKTVIKYADSEYLKNVDKIIENQSLSDAVAFSNKWGIVDDLKKYSSVLSDIETVSTSAIDYYKNLTKALSVQKADEARIEFLKQMKKAGSNNYYFVTAVDNVISMYESSYSSLALSQGAQTMLKHGMSVLFSEAKKACPEAEIIIDGLKIYNEGLNWLFNSDDISNNNLKLIIIYTIGSYAGTAMRNLRDTYQSNPTENNARAFINGYLGYLKYQEYASNSTIGFVSSALFDGVVNQISNCFSDKNSLTYDEFEEYFHNDISFCQSLEKLVQKHYDLYYAIIDYDATTITDDDLQDHLTEVNLKSSTNDESEDLYTVAYQMLISGQSIIKHDWKLSDDINIVGDLYVKSGRVDINGYKLSVEGNLNQTGGDLYINKGELKVSGNYNRDTYCDGLTMKYDEDLFVVCGDYSAKQYESNDYSLMTAGTLKIAGNLYLNSQSAFISIGKHKVVFNGNKKQKIKTSNCTWNEFNDIEFQNKDITWNGYMRVYGKVTGDVSLTSENLLLQDLTLDNNTVTINGDLCLSYLEELDINHGRLKINGNFLQPCGTVKINGGQFEVNGDYRIQSYEENEVTGEMEYGKSTGSLIMKKTKDYMKINGDFITNIKRGENYYHTNNYYLSSGVIEIGGDFKQLGASISFTDTNKLIFNGDHRQKVFLSESQNTKINTIEFKNNDIEFCSKMCGWTLQEDTYILNGFPYGICGDFDLNGYKLYVEGDLLQPSGVMLINRGELYINGDYRIQSYTKNEITDEMEYTYSYGFLKMLNSKDLVVVKGDFYIQGYYDYSYNKLLIGGIMEITGDFFQIGFCEGNFECTDYHTVILNGDKHQTVYFGDSNSHFNILRLTKAKSTGYTFEPDNCWNTLYLDIEEPTSSSVSESVTASVTETSETTESNTEDTESSSTIPTEQSSDNPTELITTDQTQPTSDNPTDPLATDPTKPTAESPTDSVLTEPTTMATEPVTVITNPETIDTQPTDKETIPSTIESSSSATEQTEPVVTISYLFLPDVENENKGYNYKLLIQDNKGILTIYDFIATDVKIEGVKVYSAAVPADIIPAMLQYQMYNGDTWVSQFSMDGDKIKEVIGNIVRNNGSIFGAVEPTEPVVTEPQPTTPAPTTPVVEPIQSNKVKPSTIVKKANPIKVTVKAKTVKLKKLKKKAQTIKAITIKSAKGKVSCKITKAAKIKKYLKINAKGVITFKAWKKAKKGTYKIKVKITVKGNSKYKPKTIKKTVKITLN